MQVSEQIIEVLNYICEKIGITIDWTSANIIPYLNVLCEKYIRYEIATSAVWLVIGIIGVVIFSVFCRSALEGCKRPKYSFSQDDWVALFAICLIGTMSFTAVIIYQVLDIIECCTIPEKVMLDYVLSLLQKTKG
ncbi:MAG: hypothetical protein ACI4KF_12325 [Huintestinicola sp.]